jgi:predicted amidohydrolase
MIVALAQLNSTPDLDANLAASRALAADAAARGARWLLFPENAPFLGAEADKLPIAQGPDGDIVGAYRDIARTHGMHVTLGSFAETGPDPKRTYNTQVQINPDGEVTQTYRKIHLFDAELPSGQVLLESDAIARGEELATAQVDDVHVGLSICYDLRFPELYRELAARGVHALTVPSAFTVPTGHAHWHALLRARAIENQCYVLAPNQWGHHCKGRESFGQSVVYDPWGRMLATAPDRVCVITAELDLGYLDAVRRRMPCGSHRVL